jgi:nitroimidazol reductase NimA-like FMN-containing flavoprotein (pyridoxamine 5'-phosphate oxidase superfamily)
MRREDREISDRTEIDAILAEAMVCRIGLTDENGPYVVPVSFGYEDGSLYFHSAPAGKKLGMLKKQSRCCFEADICDHVIRNSNPCSWGMRYRSVIGFGRAAILEGPEEKRHGLNCIMRHYGGSGTYDFSEKDLMPVIVVRIAVESVTGKKHD